MGFELGIGSWQEHRQEEHGAIGGAGSRDVLIGADDPVVGVRIRDIAYVIMT